MHILEKYALESASKIDKPFIFETFFPLPFQKYISFAPFNKNKQKYLYWEDVINILSPYLEKESIKIVQLNGPKVNNCFCLSEQIDFKQQSYLVKHSLLHFGSDNFCSQAASFFNKNIVTIYGDFPPENKKPYWGISKNCTNIFAESIKKPSYNVNEDDDINEIKPEQIAVKILDFLNIKYEKMISTEFIGKNYINKTFEIIPNGTFQYPEHVSNLIIRMDYYFNENYLDFFLSNKKSIIITDKPINLNLLEKHKLNIISIIYEITSDNNSDFILNIKNIGIKYDLISYLEEKELNKNKMDYLDLGLIHKKEPQNLKKDFISKNKNYLFKSSKFLLSKDGVFSTKYHWINNIQIKEIPLFDLNIDNKEFENLYIFSIDK